MIFLADFYYDIESNIYKMDQALQNTDSSVFKKMLASENDRIRDELLQMELAEIQMVSSVITKSLLLRQVSESMILTLSLTARLRASHN